MDALNHALAGVVAWIEREPGVALIAFLLLQLALFTVAISAFGRTARIARRQARLLRGVDGDSLETMLLDYADNAASIRDNLAAARDSGSANADALRRGLRRVGLVRFDAFTDIGGKQSFALALLDDRDSGIILSGIYSRNDMRVYAKPLVAGKSPVLLTDEEKKAVGSARLPSELQLDDSVG